MGFCCGTESGECCHCVQGGCQNVEIIDPFVCCFEWEFWAAMWDRCFESAGICCCCICEGKYSEFFQCGGLLGCCGWIFVFFPLIIIFLSFYIGLAIILITFTPPFAIVVQEFFPVFKSDVYEPFGWLQGRPMPRADPTENGHKDPWYQTLWIKGWFRVFLVSCVLTCAGWIPGVIFGWIMGFYHLFRYIRS